MSRSAAFRVTASFCHLLPRRSERRIRTRYQWHIDQRSGVSSHLSPPFQKILQHSQQFSTAPDHFQAQENKNKLSIWAKSSRRCSQSTVCGEHAPTHSLTPSRSNRRVAPTNTISLFNDDHQCSYRINDTSNSCLDLNLRGLNLRAKSLGLLQNELVHPTAKVVFTETNRLPLFFGGQARQ
jgi:hypothetical protein